MDPEFDMPEAVVTVAENSTAVNPLSFHSEPRSSIFMNESSDDDDDDTGMGHTKLYAIIEEAVPRPEETRTPSPAEALRRAELIDATWDRVRKWLRTHPSDHQRHAAASIRGQSDATPLHMVCKLDNIPSDIVQSLVEAAPETAGWTDSHGWLPLHHACAYGAPPEVLLILMDAYPEGKTKQDNQNRTPLHFYATRRTENAQVMADNVQFLADSGAAELPDRGGMLPMHYACAYGTNPAVLEVLAQAFPDSYMSRENKGRTPMHLAMVNAHRASSPGVIRFLLQQSKDNSSVNMRDSDGFLPLHLLAAGLRGVRVEEREQRNNVADCLSMYLDAKPMASADFLTALQDLPDWLQDVAVVSDHVRQLLNEKIVQRFHTFILMMDFYFLIIIIVCFELATKTAIDERFSDDNSFPVVTPSPAPNFTLSPSSSPAPSTFDSLDDDGGHSNRHAEIALLFVGASYFLLREVVQIVSLISLDSIGSWFTDSTNWLDMAVIIMVFYFTSLIVSDETSMTASVFRAGCASTKGVLWVAVIYFLKSTMVEFAVFVDGVFYVLVKLAAFLMAVSVILVAFAQMFFILYTRSEICGDDNEGFSDLDTVNATTDGIDGYIEIQNTCNFPHCTFERSLLKVYTMMMGEIGDETRYETNTVAQILYVCYAFLVVILLSNVLIAIVTDSYEVIQNDRAAIVFWSNRLDFVAEMDAISYGFKKKMHSMKGGNSAPGAPTHVQESPSGPPIATADPTENRSSQKDVLREWWSQIMLLFDPNLSDDYELEIGQIEFWVYTIFRAGAILFVIPVWLALGLVTAGWLWPPQVREYLFVQTDTTISRADIEKSKLNKLKEVQTDIKNLKSEIREEMAGDRDQAARLKAEVETIQSEIASDLQQVRELMTTLLDMGRQRD